MANRILTNEEVKRRIAEILLDITKQVTPGKCKGSFKFNKYGQTYVCSQPKGHKLPHIAINHGVSVIWPTHGSR